MERVNTAISKVNMRDRIQIRQTLSIEATFALNQAKKVFQSKGVRCSLRRERTRRVRVDQERECARKRGKRTEQFIYKLLWRRFYD